MGTDSRAYPTRLPIARIKIGTRQRKDPGDLRGLARSVERRLLHPVVIRPDYQLISGFRRIKAFERLGRTEIDVHVVEGLEDTLEALRAEAEENTCRADFTPSEAVAMARAIEEEVKKAARARQRAGKSPDGKAGGRGRKKPPGDSTGGFQARDEVAKAVGMGWQKLQHATEIVEAAEDDPAWASFVEDMDRSKNVNGTHRRLKTAQADAEIRARPPAMPTGRYSVILNDPAWPYGHRADDPSHRASNPYPSLSLDQIQALPIASLAEPDCILWLWTTNAFIFDARDIVKGWGFEYKNTLTWGKTNRIGTGDNLRGQTEHCLLAFRGEPVHRLDKFTTLLLAPAGRHSEKPEAFYRMVEESCPGSKCELFARRRREGWVCHGHGLQ
jgi:N6-adenosine-specific RNA methylase IME4/ParB-like chromosome segregation protein Spo0J